MAIRAQKKEKEFPVRCTKCGKVYKVTLRTAKQKMREHLKNCNKN